MKSKAVDALRKAMRKNGLTQREVATMCGVSVKTVESWLADPALANFRQMPPRHLLVLQLSLAVDNKNERK